MTIYEHEPRLYYKDRRLYCLSDGEPWPCRREQLRRTKPKHIPPNHAGSIKDCPACMKAKELLAENRAEADRVIATQEFEHLTTFTSDDWAAKREQDERTQD